MGFWYLNVCTNLCMPMYFVTLAVPVFFFIVPFLWLFVIFFLFFLDIIKKIQWQKKKKKKKKKEI